LTFNYGMYNIKTLLDHRQKLKDRGNRSDSISVRFTSHRHRYVVVDSFVVPNI